MYSMYINDILMPVTPGSISLKIGNNNKTVTLINEGEVNLIKTPGLTEITIDELLLPAVHYPFAHYGSMESIQDVLYNEKNKTFHRPQYYLAKLEAWKKQKKPVKFKLIRTTPNYQKLLWDTKFDCTIEDYEIMEDADKYGMDVCVKLSLKEYRYWGVKKLVLKKKKGNGVIGHAKKSRRSKEAARTYKTKKGDTLKKIAKKQLNDTSKAKKVYTLNKKVIESAAKKHGRKSSSNGRYLYKGTKLKLPR